MNFFSSATCDCEAPSQEELSYPLAPLPVVTNPTQAKDQFEFVYLSPRRLKNRVHWSSQKKNYIFKKLQSEQILPQFFIENLKNHLQQALSKGYAKHLYYSDLGHLHLLAPQQNWYPQMAQESFFKSTELLSLFHTGELYQFKKGGSLAGPMTDNEDWLWIYRHRNFVGKNQPLESILPLFSHLNAAYNTVRSIEGYKEIGSVYFSANQNGCFFLETSNSTLRFDISVSL